MEAEAASRLAPRAIDLKFMLNLLQIYRCYCLLRHRFIHQQQAEKQVVEIYRTSLRFREPGAVFQSQVIGLLQPLGIGVIELVDLDRLARLHIDPVGVIRQRLPVALAQ